MCVEGSAEMSIYFLGKRHILFGDIHTHTISNIHTCEKAIPPTSAQISVERIRAIFHFSLENLKLENEPWSDIRICVSLIQFRKQHMTVICLFWACFALKPEDFILRRCGSSGRKGLRRPVQSISERIYVCSLYDFFIGILLAVISTEKKCTVNFK